MNRIRMFIEISIDIIKDAINIVLNVISNNIKNVAKILNFCLPYIMYMIGTTSLLKETYINLIIPIIIFIIIYYLKSYANKIGKGETVPVPIKRFTEKDEESGEVSIEQERLQELILYIEDLENWIERKGLSK